MSIEIGNVVHAMATMSGASYFGQGNVGFAPFGVGPDFTEKVTDGETRLHLLSPLSFLDGEGQVQVTAFTQGDPPLFPRSDITSVVGFLLSGPSKGDILVQTKIHGNLTTVPFSILVLRYPQQSTKTT